MKTERGPVVLVSISIFHLQSMNDEISLCLFSLLRKQSKGSYDECRLLYLIRAISNDHTKRLYSLRSLGQHLLTIDSDPPFPSP